MAANLPHIFSLSFAFGCAEREMKQSSLHCALLTNPNGQLTTPSHALSSCGWLAQFLFIAIVYQLGLYTASSGQSEWPGDNSFSCDVDLFIICVLK